jgi:hypothetical protein
LIAFGVVAATPAVAAAPSLVVFGAFFPAWILCAVIGVVGAVLVRAALVKLKLDELLPAKLIVYLAFAILIGIGVWRVWYAGGPA